MQGRTPKSALRKTVRARPATGRKISFAAVREGGEGEESEDEEEEEAEEIEHVAGEAELEEVEEDESQRQTGRNSRGRRAARRRVERIDEEVCEVAGRQLATQLLEPLLAGAGVIPVMMTIWGLPCLNSHE